MPKFTTIWELIVTDKSETELAETELMRKEIQSMRMKLKHHDGTVLFEVMEALVQWRDLPGELVIDVVNAGLRSVAVTSGHLARLASHCESSSLYPALADKRSFGNYEYAEIFTRHYYPDIEEKLCTHVYKNAQDKNCLESFGTYFNALAANGRQHTLEMMETLAYEMQPKAQSADVISKCIRANLDGQERLSEAFLTCLEGEMLVDRYLKVGEVIEEVQHRMEALENEKASQNADSADSTTCASSGSASKNPVRDARDALLRNEMHRQKANEHRLLKKLDDSMTNYRKAAEALLKAAWYLTVNKKPTPLMLDDQKNKLKQPQVDPKLPATIESAIERIQKLANSPAHDNDEYLPTTEAALNTVIESLDAVEKWVAELMARPTDSHSAKPV